MPTHAQELPKYKISDFIYGTFTISGQICGTFIISEQICGTFIISEQICGTFIKSEHICGTFTISEHICGTFIISEHISVVSRTHASYFVKVKKKWTKPAANQARSSKALAAGNSWKSARNYCCRTIRGPLPGKRLQSVYVCVCDQSAYVYGYIAYKLTYKLVLITIAYKLTYKYKAYNLTYVHGKQKRLQYMCYTLCAVPHNNAAYC